MKDLQSIINNRADRKREKVFSEFSAAYWGVFKCHYDRSGFMVYDKNGKAIDCHKLLKILSGEHSRMATDPFRESEALEFTRKIDALGNEINELLERDQ